MLSSGRSPVVSVGLAAVVAALYAVLMASLFVLRIGVTVMLPAWTMWAVPVALYAFLTLVSVTGVPVLKRFAVFGTLCAVYAAVAALTGCLVSAASGVDFALATRQASSRFMPAPLLQLFVVPMLLLPFRSLLTERPRQAPSRPRSQAERTPSRPVQEAVPGWESAPRLDSLRPDPGLAFAAPKPATPPVTRTMAPEPEAPTGLSFAAPSFRAPVAESARDHNAVEPAGTSVVPGMPEVGRPSTVVTAAVEPPVTPAAVVTATVEPPVMPAAVVTATVEPQTAQTIEPVVERVRATESALDTGVAPESDDVVAIPFDRVESQLSADLFSGALAEIATRLREPGHLLIPVREVLPQLVEGMVVVRWDEVAGQFPADAFAGGVSAVAERLAGGRLVLPLDELVRRLPPDVFALSAAAPDVSALESFPLPFQPVSETPEPEPVAEPLEVEAPAMPSAVADSSMSPPAVPSPAASPVISDLAPALAALRLATARTPEPVSVPVGAVSTVAAPLVGEAAPVNEEFTLAEAAPTVGETAPAATPPPAVEPVTVAVESLLPPAPPAMDTPVASAFVVETFERTRVTEPPVVAPPAMAESFVVEAFAPAPVVEPPVVAPPAMAESAVVEAFASAPVVEPPVVTPPVVAETFEQPPAVESPAPVIATEAPAAPDDTESPVEAAALAESRLDRLAGALSPLGALTSSVTEIAGATVYVFRAPVVPADGVMQVAVTALPLLGAGPTPVEQLTLRFEHGAIVLTPLAAVEPGPTLLVASAPRNGALALLEMLSLRARPSNVSRSAAPRFDGAAPVEELDPVAGGPAADLLAGALRGFGAFRPSVLRDPAGRVELCLLQAPGDETRAIGSFAHAACCTLSPAGVGGTLGAVQSAVFRLGPRRLALRPFEGRPGHWIALCTPGDGARPGLVHLEMERAAAHAGAR